MFAILMAASLADLLLLFKAGNVTADRKVPQRLSNGSENEVSITTTSNYPFQVSLRIFEDFPEQFQIRDKYFAFTLKPGSTSSIVYKLRPVKRGEYVFGYLNIHVSGVLGLMVRRFRFCHNQKTQVYPSFAQMKKYEIMAISNRLTEAGIKKVRKIGSGYEFEHIRQYVQGDDPRKVNWKATARKGELMVNNFQDEKAQQIYCLIDKGRAMKMPFEDMSLLDYAINSSLVLSNTALIKGDKAGIITFSDKTGTILPAERRTAQINNILETLYNQKTRYAESDFENLYVTVRAKLNQRSLLMLFTNFESPQGMRRQLYYLKALARHHKLVVIFFVNTELQLITQAPVKTVEDIYIKTTAEKFILDKHLIVKELNKEGIQTILCPPKELTISTLNKYLEIKAANLI
jgi:uncharacterized protein (DUF58 family)